MGKWLEMDMISLVSGSNKHMIYRSSGMSTVIGPRKRLTTSTTVHLNKLISYNLRKEKLSLFLYSKHLSTNRNSKKLFI